MNAFKANYQHPIKPFLERWNFLNLVLNAVDVF